MMNRAANESISSELYSAQLIQKFERVQTESSLGSSYKIGSCSARNDVESISSEFRAKKDSEISIFLANYFIQFKPQRHHNKTQ